MKKAILILCLLTCFSLLLCACGGNKNDVTGEASVESATEASQQPTTPRETDEDTSKVSDPVRMNLKNPPINAMPVGLRNIDPEEWRSRI